MVVLTLNIAHGRANTTHQALLSRAQLRAHLDAIAALLVQADADVVALQEVDAPCWWSRHMDQAAYLAEAAGYDTVVQDSHETRMGLSYGTALLLRGTAARCAPLVLPNRLPTPLKGASGATLETAGGPLQLSSVHLDFLGRRNRADQVDALVGWLRERPGPHLVAGDFNAEWTRGSAVQRLCEALDLRPFRPHERTITFDKTRRRLDWVLASPELEWVEQEVLEPRVSDHRAVRATLKWR